MCECLLRGFKHLAALLQVTWYQTPDRAVLSFLNVSTGSGGQSSWQVGYFLLMPISLCHIISSQGSSGFSCCTRRMLAKHSLFQVHWQTLVPLRDALQWT